MLFPRPVNVNQNETSMKGTATKSKILYCYSKSKVIQMNGACALKYIPEEYFSMQKIQFVFVPVHLNKSSIYWGLHLVRTND